MGQKTHPIGLRLGIVKQSSSRWFATKDMPALLKEDELIRKYLKTRLSHAAIADVHIERDGLDAFAHHPAHLLGAVEVRIGEGARREDVADTALRLDHARPRPRHARCR